MSRQELRESERRNFYLYIDEFQNFVTPSMAAILSGARKYRLGLILAHQDLRQLWDRDTAVASSVISNPCTRVCFRLGDFDAKKLEEGFSFFDARDLQSLGVGEAICRVERAEHDFNLKTLPLPKVDLETARARRERLVALSRERYARRREEVVAETAVASVEAVPQPAPLKARTREARREHKTPRPVGAATGPEVGSQITSPESALLGRGGQQHKYLQQLIRRMAESKGYRATVEKQILDGLGSVDVALEKEGCSIACEISVTSTTDQEVGNIQKCLAAGFEHVVLVSSDKKVLGKARVAISTALNKDQVKRVAFLTPEELFTFIDTLEVEVAGREEAVRDSKELLTAK